ncbi:FAD-binding domain [Nitrobacter sp.]|uniref:FAD-binding domain n=1 Tax=Nitrobacter sp. TaxID=29420 RepID=UPI00399D5BE7
MNNRKILISGAGIAGPSVAYWLRQYGFEPVLIERAPTLRTGGYLVDFWGLGFEVADRMGLLPALDGDAYDVDEVRIVDEHGRKAGGFSANAIRSVLGDRFLSILRSDLARLIYDSLHGEVRTMFGDTITAIEQDENGVRVSFRHAPAENFDLVIGAGGLHSPVREIVFGPEERFEKYLGYYTASFVVTGYPHRDSRAYVGYAPPGRQVSRYALRGDRTVFFFVFATEERLKIAPHDTLAQKQTLREVFGRDGWECPAILKALDDTDDLYFDSVSQIRMPSWTAGRVALVGDACSCPSLLAGQGTSLAMGAAYILAGELSKAEGDYRVAFKVYESMLQSVMAGKQRSAERFASSFAPKTRWGIFVRNQVTRLMALPFVAKLAMRGLLTDPLTLPRY